jgi:hypothetical protein
VGRRVGIRARDACAGNRSHSQRLACTDAVGKRRPAFTSRCGGGIDGVPEMEKMNIHGYFGQEGKKET